MSILLFYQIYCCVDCPYCIYDTQQDAYYEECIYTSVLVKLGICLLEVSIIVVNKWM
jgi:hypothetical protein